MLSVGKKIGLGVVSLFVLAGIFGGSEQPNQSQQSLETPGGASQSRPIDTTKQSELETIETKTETVTEQIAYQSLTQNDASLAAGRSVVATQGAIGERTITYEISYANGLEVGRKQISSAVTKEPVNQITKIGTKQAPAPGPTQSNSDGVVKKSRSNICHAPGTTYYSRTLHFTPYQNIQACLNSGGRLPLR